MPVAYDPQELRASDLMLNSRTRGASPRFGLVCTPQPHRDLSPPERRWCLETKKPGDPWEPAPFNMSVIWRYQGELHPECLQRAARAIVERHAILGCTLEFVDCGWRFRANRAPPIGVNELDISKPNPVESAVMGVTGEFLFREFDFAVEGPLRVGYAQLGREEYIIAVAVHHAFADAYSKRILSFELAAFYDGFCRGTEAQLAPLPLTYFDYVISVEEWSRGAAATQVIEFWREQLHRAVPLKHTRAERLSGARFQLSVAASAKVREICSTMRVGVPVFWEAIHHWALSRLLGTEEVMTLSVDGGRKQPELTGVFGQFVNMYPLRSRLSDRLTFVDTLEQLQARKRESSPYRTLPYDLIAEQCPFEYAAAFGHLNYIPRQFFALPTFGPLSTCALPPGAKARFMYPYTIAIRDEPRFAVACGGHICAPFNPRDLSLALERIAMACVTDPQRPIERC